MLIVTASAQAQDSAKAPAQATPKSWIFDQGLYTNDSKTGERVWQYSTAEPAYRDPDALYDSPHGSYPFQPDVYDPYSLYYPNPYGVPMYYPPPIYGHVPLILPPPPYAP